MYYVPYSISIDIKRSSTVRMGFSIFIKKSSSMYTTYTFCVIIVGEKTNHLIIRDR